MLTIFATTEQQATCLAFIQTEARLEELISFRSLEDTHPGSLSLVVRDDHISLPLDWSQRRPPILFPSQIPFDVKHLLGLIFHLLENDQKAWDYLHTTPLYAFI